MKNFQFADIRNRPDVLGLKRRLGMAYGMTVGLAFAASAWGVDGYSQPISLVANCTKHPFMVELMQNFTVARAKRYER